MQRLEVSCAVRYIYMSLGARGLILVSLSETCRPITVWLLSDSNKGYFVITCVRFGLHIGGKSGVLSSEGTSGCGEY